nr:hypothetical protein Ade03nite_66560 [Actinoplanes derwentensis]
MRPLVDSTCPRSASTSGSATDEVSVTDDVSVLDSASESDDVSVMDDVSVTSSGREVSSTAGVPVSGTLVSGMSTVRSVVGMSTVRSVAESVGGAGVPAEDSRPGVLRIGRGPAGRRSGRAGFAVVAVGRATTAAVSDSLGSDSLGTVTGALSWYGPAS